MRPDSESADSRRPTLLLMGETCPVVIHGLLKGAAQRHDSECFGFSTPPPKVGDGSSCRWPIRWLSPFCRVDSCLGSVALTQNRIAFVWTPLPGRHGKRPAPGIGSTDAFAKTGDEQLHGETDDISFSPSCSDDAVAGSAGASVHAQQTTSIHPSAQTPKEPLPDAPSSNGWSSSQTETPVEQGVFILTDGASQNAGASES